MEVDNAGSNGWTDPRAKRAASSTGNVNRFDGLKLFARSD